MLRNVFSFELSEGVVSPALLGRDVVGVPSRECSREVCEDDIAEGVGSLEVLIEADDEDAMFAVL